MNQIIEARRQFSIKRTKELIEKLSNISSIEGAEGCCVYVTGSYAREEATAFSDLDIFIVSRGDRNHGLSRITEAHIVSELAKAQKDLEFPEFTDGGEYLALHYVDEIIKNLGNSKDDYSNSFTARMLLLLESKPVYGTSAYKNYLKRVVDAYFKDFHDHTEDFRPIFLANDVLRFWRTICLNYENKREWRDQDDAARAKAHLQNLKLKFSRRLICFSTIAFLVSKGAGIEPKDFIEMLRKNPIQRMKAAVTDDLQEGLLDLIDSYAWFLERMNNPAEIVRSWILDESIRRDAFQRADQFGDYIYELVFKLAERNRIAKFLVV